nr:synaptic vesicle glycoprotein 2C-like isoform X1 [Ciona intestinalis]|eukprot:XP_026693273.1 synaptic vesicle glycoprotein 2C-like isoform X1 [Ciona intestinalis]
MEYLVPVDANNDTPLSDVDENDRLVGNNRKATYKVASAQAGFGRWHYLLLLQCGWANASDAIEIMCISFTISSVHASLKLSNSSLTWLTIVLFLGMMIGGYLWGTLADYWGRRRVVIFSLALNGIFGTFSAIAPNYGVLLTLRFISGIGAGGSLPVCFSYFSEFQPRDKRGMMISALATSWMVGNVIAAGLAWGLLPYSASISAYSPNGDQWRLFIIICAIPSLTSSVFFFFMPESPLYLYRRGDFQKSLAVLKIVNKFNHPGTPLQFDTIVPDDDCPTTSRIKGSRSGSTSFWFVTHTKFYRLSSCPRRCLYWLVSGLYAMKVQLAIFFGSDRNTRKKSVLMMSIYFATAFSGYGITMWLPTLMARTEQNAGSPCSGHIVLNKSSTSVNDSEMYIDVFIGATAQLPANIASILVMDRVGGKVILVFSMFMSGVSVLLFWLVHNKLQVIIMSAIFNGVSTLAWNALDVLTPEMYETAVRASSTGILTALSRIASILGNLTFGLFMDYNCSIPILICAAVFLLGGVLSIFLPQTRNIELD